MNTQEHLQRIKDKCYELLAIAEKRTPGRWKLDKEGNIMWCESSSIHSMIDQVLISENDCSFIASCAGEAEAGWKATIAAIDGFTDLEPLQEFVNHIPTKQIEIIIAAWPEELL